MKFCYVLYNVVCDMGLIYDELDIYVIIKYNLFSF